jgi:sodium-dependent dicarboxylate transporter 2/3/5
MGGLGLVTAFLSMWVSNTATTAMMLPIALGILTALHDVRLARGETPGLMDAATWPLGAGMLLMVAYSASIGGIGTPVGSPPNLIGIGLIRQTTGVEIHFFRWMAVAVPLLLLMGIALFGLLCWLHPVREKVGEQVGRPPFEPADLRGDVRGHLQDYIRSERIRVGPWTAGQRNTLAAFCAAVVLWVVPGVLHLPWFAGWRLSAWMSQHMPESIVAMGAAILLFVLPVDLSQGRFTLSWREAERIDWGTILLFGGGLALGSLMFDTGVARVVGEGLTRRLGIDSLWMLTGLSIALAIGLSETASNTASANMIIPVVIAIAQAAGLSPLPPALGACLGASFGFMLPVSTPPNAIVYGSGLVPLPRMLRAGMIFDVVGFFIIWGGLRVLCPVLGLM